MKTISYLYGEIHRDDRVVITRLTAGGMLQDHTYCPTPGSLARVKAYARRKCTRRENGVLSFAEYAI